MAILETQHKALDKKIDKSVDSINKSFVSIIKEHEKHQNEVRDLKDDRINEKLDSVICSLKDVVKVAKSNEADISNIKNNAIPRLNAIEDETKVVRFFEKNPKLGMLVLVAIGITILTNTMDIF